MAQDGVRKEYGDVEAPPALGDSGISLPPGTGLERLQSFAAGVCILGPRHRIILARAPMSLLVRSPQQICEPDPLVLEICDL
jgi:hypothetical protein